MPALVENMMYVGREVPWHGLGISVEEAPNSREAIVLAGLDWNVEKKPVYDEKGNIIKGFYRTARDKDNATFGIVTDRYRIVQNVDAFSFTDNLIGEEAKYETAGSLDGGKRIWLLARLPEKMILGDKFENFVCFTNKHDGKGSVQVCMTPIRVVCNNTLNLALSQASRKWSTRHIGRLEDKLYEGRRALELAGQYMDALNEEAQVLADIKVDQATAEHFMDVIFPFNPEKDSERKKKNIDSMKEAFFQCMKAPDLSAFTGTGWGVINAMTDFVDHGVPTRMTQSYQEKNWENIIGGHANVDQMFTLISSLKAAV